MRWWLMLLACGLLGCEGTTPQPVAVDTANDACANCRMIVSDPRVAAQIVAPGDEPLFFDDIGCLRTYLATHEPPDSAAVYVADHRTGAWAPAAAAVYTRSPVFRTPMGSDILAHADAASRASDPAAADGRDVSVAELFGNQRLSGDRP